jgi:hypothetical protein
MIFTFVPARNFRFKCVLFEQQVIERLAISGKFRLVCPKQIVKRGVSALCKGRGGLCHLMQATKGCRYQIAPVERMSARRFFMSGTANV